MEDTLLERKCVYVQFSARYARIVRFAQQACQRNTIPWSHWTIQNTLLEAKRRTTLVVLVAATAQKQIIASVGNPSWLSLSHLRPPPFFLSAAAMAAASFSASCCMANARCFPSGVFRYHFCKGRG